MDETTHLTPGATAEGECLLCGHWMRFKVWNALNGTGICEGCFDSGKTNRGPCSLERGCDCGVHGLNMTKVTP
jgi:hypothetical protein